MVNHLFVETYVLDQSQIDVDEYRIELGLRDIHDSIQFIVLISNIRSLLAKLEDLAGLVIKIRRLRQL